MGSTQQWVLLQLHLIHGEWNTGLAAGVLDCVPAGGAVFIINLPLAQGSRHLLRIAGTREGRLAAVNASPTRSIG